ncbi:hypothetical protein BOX15_Mlig010534g4, partial [Macrostomum lignano]
LCQVNNNNNSIASTNSQSYSYSALQVVDDLNHSRRSETGSGGAVPASGPLLSLMFTFDINLEHAVFVLHACHGVLAEALFVLASGGALRSTGLPVWTPQDDADVLSCDIERMRRVRDRFGRVDVCLRLIYLGDCGWPEPDRDPPELALCC